ncbi:hypothetical protein [uncultured Tateyamaria sp.]|uniref:hypothetical protein n=1 Tax=uncultured Tateyamaria sp. TaxID=455651 RepID=UPI0026165B2C|nr:hypothetical protein [uncultured Tateyamaria sp.]
MRGFLIWLVALGVTLTGAAQAQSVPVYDPSALPMRMVQTRVDACGVALGADPVWPASPVRETASDGQPVRGTSFELGRTYWNAQGNPASAFVVHPYFSMHVTCKPTTLSASFDGLSFFADQMHTSSKKRGLKPKRLKKLTVQGLGTVYALQEVTRVTSGEVARIGSSLDIVSYFALHRGQLVTIRVTVQREVPDLYVRSVRKGKVVSFTRDDGQTVAFKLGANAKAHLSSGAIGVNRKPSENNALFKRIEGSLVGY